MLGESVRMEARLGRGERITALLRERFGIDEIPEGYVLLSSAKKARLVSTEALDFLDVASVAGVYVAKETPFGPHLSIEGSRLLGPLATKNVVEVDPEDVDAWMSGSDIEKGEVLGVEPGPVIVKSGEIYLGSGYYDGRRIRNMVSRARRSEQSQPLIDYALRREKEERGEGT